MGNQQTFSDLSEFRSISLNRSRKWFLIDFHSLLKTEDWAKKSLLKMLKFRSITFLGKLLFKAIFCKNWTVSGEKWAEFFYLLSMLNKNALSLVKWQFSKLCNLSPCFFNFIFFQIVARFCPKYGCFQSKWLSEFWAKNRSITHKNCERSGIRSLFLKWFLIDFR